MFQYNFYSLGFYLQSHLLFSYMDDLAKAGRLKNYRTVKEQRGKKMAENMLQAGHDRLIIWESDSKCRVPSEVHQDDVVYHVDITKAVCDCPASSQGGM